MNNEKKIEILTEEKYQVLFGVRKLTFDSMLAMLETAYGEMRKKDERKRKLSVLDMLMIMLGYYHDYRTMENLAFDHGVHKQRISEAVIPHFLNARITVKTFLKCRDVIPHYLVYYAAPAS
ncbi:MAG: hypothetical protein FWC78_07415 [Defluviitaleaceae bacterium]|nr:hypothetical protein [Defluviitaleaceae bacterium]